LKQTLQTLRERLLAARDARGVWTGELSASALSTALAVTALRRAPVQQQEDPQRWRQGVAWLRATQLPDGSWGDTPASAGNLSTTAIVWATLRDLRGAASGSAASAPAPALADALRRAEGWIAQRAGSTAPAALVKAIGTVYGADRTFAVPILSHLAWCGALGTPGQAWQAIPPLPYLLALLPRPLLALLRLRVVSYALPALIAIGLARPLALVRARGRRAGCAALAQALLRRLGQLQPSHGGFLDAAPLTAFVALGLAAAGYGDHDIAQRCRGFLREGQRPTGAWPIDTDLSLWVTSLATRALTAVPDATLDGVAIISHLGRTQQRARHPFTGAAPGGWGWSDRAGAVPDGDDTAGALIALHRLNAPMGLAIRDGLAWLLNLQNRDGGLPTFCRGWGRLPFDQSCPDLTAHACAAWDAWAGQTGGRLRRRLRKARHRALGYLQRRQNPDGSWHPLWFGNALRPDSANPTLGTARVLTTLLALRDLDAATAAACTRGERWLLAAQKPDGSWGADRATPSTIEETAWGVMALAHAEGTPEAQAAARRGAAWLAHQTASQSPLSPAPIGLYFAQLWYAEKLYPLIWSVEALGRVLQLSASDAERPQTGMADRDGSGGSACPHPTLLRTDDHPPHEHAQIGIIPAQAMLKGIIGRLDREAVDSGRLFLG
jgi:squalene-hopene/tetraprenyl-beta-curcumene cyclase